jgi:hypothetical protein
VRRLIVRFLTIAGLVFLQPAFAQDVPPVTPPPPNPPEPPTVNMNRFVPSAEGRTIAFFASLFPDCTSKGPLVGRVTTKPKHGAVALAPTESFPFYGPNSPLATCNSKKVPGLGIIYRSEDDYVGEDHANILLIFPDGTATQLNILFLVR